MVNEYKKIVLLIGLEAISDYHFRLIKSLLAKDLKLTRNMQDDYDRIQIADLMEEKFQSDAGLRKLIAVCRDIPALADLAETLEKRRLKVKGKSKGKKKSTVRKVQQDEPTTAPTSSPTNTNSEAESKEERPLSKENEDKNSEDPEGMQLPLEHSQFLAPSATSKQQTEGCSQTPHGPPPTPPSTPPIKEMDDTNKQTHDNMKVQESQGQRRLPELSEVGTQTTVSMFRTSHMSPRKPSGSLQTPEMHPTAPPSSLQTPRIPPTAPPSSLQTPRIPPTAPPSSLQTPRIPPTAPPSSLQTPRIPPTAPPSSLQTPRIPPTAPSSSLQTPQIPPTAPSSSLQTPQIPPTAPSGKTHTTHLSPTSSREIQTPHLNSTSSLMASSRMPTPHLSPTSSSRIQIPQVDPAIPPTTLQTPLMTPTSFSSCSPKNPRLTTIPKDASIECGYKKGPKEVMVLKATEPFTYEFKESEKRMFHATVATESEFFRVKVFDITLKEKFIPKKVIAISDYIGRNGFLEIYSASSVSDVSANRKMEISYRLVQNANATPKIEYLCSRCPVKCVNGVYTVYKKNVKEDCTYYEIRDNTGQMEVVVHRRLMYINCEEGDKLKLFCFELTFNVDKWQLRSVTHSYIKVIKARKLKIGPLHPDSNMETSQDSP